MIGSMRDNLKHLNWVIWATIGAFILTIFALWGGGLKSGGQQGITGDWAAKAGPVEIQNIEFFNAYRLSERNYRDIFAGTEFDAEKFQLGYIVINSLMETYLLALEAKNLGLRVTNEELADQIASMPAFQEGGKYVGTEEYLKRLSSGGISPTVWEKQVRNSMLDDKLGEYLLRSTVVTQTEIRRKYLDRYRRLSLRYFFYPQKEGLENIALSEADLRDYFGENLKDFRLPETRTISAVYFFGTDFENEVTVSEDEIKDYYERAKESYYLGDEQWRASHILIGTDNTMSEEEKSGKEALALRIMERVKKGEDFATLAKEFSTDSTNSFKGGDLGFFPKGRMVKPFENAIFAMDQGEITGPVKTSFGYHIIKLTGYRDGGQYQPLEDVRPEIESNMRNQRGRARAQDAANEFSSLAMAGKYPSAASKQNYSVKKSGYFGKEDWEDGFTGFESIRTTAFNMALDEVSSSHLVPGGFCVFTVDAIRDPMIPEFEEVRDTVRIAMKDVALEKYYEKLGKPIVDRIRNGKSTLPSEAISLDVDMMGSSTFTHTNFVRSINEHCPGLFQLAETLELGDPGMYYVPGDRYGLMVFDVETKPDFAEPDYERIKPILRKEIYGQRKGELRDSMLDALKSRYPIQINDELISQVQKSSGRTIPR